MKRILLLILFTSLFLSCDNKKEEYQNYFDEKPQDTVGLAKIWNGQWSVNGEYFTNAICDINISNSSITIPKEGTFSGTFHKESFYGDQHYANVERALILTLKNDSIKGWIKATQEDATLRSHIDGIKLIKDK